MEKNQLQNFGKKYAEAWCSQKPESVAAFFANDGSLKVNNDAPADVYGCQVNVVVIATEKL